MNPRTVRRGTFAVLSAGFVLLAAAAPASAHVTVNPKTASPGGYGALTFRVPDELPDSATVKFEVALPDDQPVAQVSIKPVPGWTATTQKRTLTTPIKTDDGTLTTAVSRIVWTGGKILPGQFQEFEISAGPLPDKAGSMVFKALQTYDNGQVVRWIDPPAPGGAEPEHPAPVLQLVKADDAAGGASATAGATAAAAAADAAAKSTGAATTTAADSGSGHDGTARWLGGGALAVALLAAIFALAGRIRPSRGERP